MSEEQWKEAAVQAGYDVHALAKLCFVSTRQLQRDFHHLFQTTPGEWLARKRIEAAQRLLLSGLSVKAVALELGFKHTSHFCRQFKTFVSQTPTEYITAQRLAVVVCR
ncbi:MAG TPA: helix-turn-helix domain-containing protein [Verrucomicrobiae bacterium]|nr:helix-turn-helix domain-containing protein [Verrucomicrobiae bacterium]